VKLLWEERNMGYRMPDKESREHLLYGELKRILSILVARDVKKVILFGSLTAGDIGSESDIDLIVVERTEKRFLERLDEVYSEVQPRVAAYSDEFGHLFRQDRAGRYDLIGIGLRRLPVVWGGFNKG
jgi:predicted nucleotidyltransferase